MPSKDRMLDRHKAHLDRLEYELGLFANSSIETDPPEPKVDLALHIEKALEGERAIIELLTKLRGTTSSVVTQDNE
ncbi:hypothetical protein ASE94_11225 [Devosia sp. Leaf64]|nr:hypothetical protein ASE94_11225 [Devosia sp. Leaf64]